MEFSQSELNEANQVPTIEHLKEAPIDAVVVCGMGPVKLQDVKGSERLYPSQPYNRLNAIAGKLLASNSIADTIITSGYKSAKQDEQEPTEIEEREMKTSEGELLADTYDRARGKGINREGRVQAERIIEIDSDAKTTFDNIMQALNLLDAKSGGYWQGNFSVLSSEFHVPRIKEMLTAFGIKNSRVLSAERILRHFGYNGRLYPTGDFGYGKSYEEFEEDVYRSQPVCLENLQDSPSYVTFELAKIKSNRRLQEIASHLKTYYVQKGISLPEVYGEIPSEYDDQFDYNVLRAHLSQVKFSKHEYRGDEYKDAAGIKRYRELAVSVGKETEDFLKSTPVL
ncbi:MAG: ElyC/SanA/YdcF family protein [Candidatus Levybacteria bacterium]|nr:ElyC/SanA/YdcF family protein [Candidatus Levybacteria bacterium]